MIPELGFFTLILALCFAGLQSTLPLIGIIKKNTAWMHVARPLAIGQCFFITLSFLFLLYAFGQDDFSVAYVATNSNAALPLVYKFSAVWGGHEGSLLLWALLYSYWMLVLNIRSRHLSSPFFTRVLIILGIISFGFLWFLLATSNPFARLLPLYPIDGQDLNPLLQDPGLIIHPPLLYMGYVGFSVPFAIALSALWGSEETSWAKWMRSWVLSAFAFLTIGIALGSWWAYYELGWGGWWFWDPVENASFMPWLVSLALIHSLMVSDKRQMFRSWSLLLAIIAFALSLVGTFLVRSGILTSVHAFANDPTRGAFLLYFLLVVVGGALGLFAYRAGKFQTINKLEIVSRETFILVSTLFLFVSTATILLGTIFPLAYDALTGEKLSVGFPYFNAVFIPLMIPVLILVPLGPLSYWGQNTLVSIAKKFKWILLSSIAMGVLFPLLLTQEISFSTYLGVFLGAGIVIGTFKIFYEKLRKQGSLRALSLGTWAVTLAHAGMGVSVLGITVVSHYQIERVVSITPGQSLKISNYDLHFQLVKSIEGSNYIGSQGHFVIYKNAKKVADLFPEKRIFVIQGSVMTETAIDPGVFRDIYVSLGDKLNDGSWSARVYYKPFVRWIWFGALMMAMGGFLGAFGRRHQKKLNS